MLTPVRHRQLHVLHTEAADAVAPDCTLFFVHGAMATLENFRAQIDHFSPMFARTVSYDYFGCGKSPRLEDSKESYTTHQHFQDLVFLFSKYKSKRNVLMGHSFGTSLVLRLAASAAGMDITCIVLIAPAIMEDGGHWIFRLPEFVLQRIQPSLSKNFAERAFHANTRAQLIQAHVELMQRSSQRSNANSMHIAKSFYNHIEFIKQHQVENEVRGEINALLICGSEDLLTPLHMAAKMKAWLDARPGAQPSKICVVDLSAHQVMEEQPQEVNAICEEFFKQCKVIIRS